MRAPLLALAFLASLNWPASADPKSEALQVVEKWAKAFTASDVDGIVSLYAPDALFLGTLSKTVVAKPEGIRKYFENALLNQSRKATIDEHTSMVLSDNVVVVTGFDNVAGNRGRVTFVLAKRGSDWKIVHFHRSRMP